MIITLQTHHFNNSVWITGLGANGSLSRLCTIREMKTLRCSTTKHHLESQSLDQTFLSFHLQWENCKYISQNVPAPLIHPCKRAEYCLGRSMSNEHLSKHTKSAHTGTGDLGEAVWETTPSFHSARDISEGKWSHQNQRDQEHPDKSQDCTSV